MYRLLFEYLEIREADQYRSAFHGVGKVIQIIMFLASYAQQVVKQISNWMLMRCG